MEGTKFEISHIPLNLLVISDAQCAGMRPAMGCRMGLGLNAESWSFAAVAGVVSWPAVVVRWRPVPQPNKSAEPRRGATAMARNSARRCSRETRGVSGGPRRSAARRATLCQVRLRSRRQLYKMAPLREASDLRGVGPSLRSWDRLDGRREWDGSGEGGAVAGRMGRGFGPASNGIEGGRDLPLGGLLFLFLDPADQRVEVLGFALDAVEHQVEHLVGVCDEGIVVVTDDELAFGL